MVDYYLGGDVLVNWDYFPSFANDPVQFVIKLALLVATFLFAWFVLSFLFLPFQLGLKKTITDAEKRISGWADLAIGLGNSWVVSIQEAFENLGKTGDFKILLYEDINNLKSTARSSGRELRKRLRKFQKAVESAFIASGGVAPVIARLNTEMARLEKVQDPDPESIILRAGMGFALFRAIFATLFWLGIMLVNTVLLHEFFSELVAFNFEVFGIFIELAWPIAIIYTFIEFMLGFFLELENEKREGKGGFSVPAFLFMVIILIMISIEMVLYGFVSNSINWPWSEEFSQQYPFVDSWLALLGFVIGAGVACSGYYTSALWKDVFVKNAIATMKKQARILSRSLDSLPGQLDRLRASSETLQNDISPDAVSQVNAERNQLKTDAERYSTLLIEKLDSISAAHFAPVAGPDLREERRYAFKVVGLGIGCAVAVLANMLQSSSSLAQTAIADMGAWAPVVFAVLITVLLLMMGRFSTSGILVTQATVSGDTNGKEYVLHAGFGVQQWAALVVGLIIIFCGVWASTAGFDNLEPGAIALGLAINGATFVVGAFLEDAFRGLAYLANAFVRILGAALVFAWSILVLIFRSLVGAVNFLLDALCAPAWWFMERFFPAFDLKNRPTEKKIT